MTGDGRLKISLCISVPDGGENFVAFLAGCAYRTMSRRHDVELHVTCHGPAMKDRLSALPLPIPVSRIHIIDREPPTYFHANSVTHSRCVNALFAGADGDLAVICDYDAMLVHGDWDSMLARLILRDKLAFFGSPYSDSVGIRFSVQKNPLLGVKYQRWPNCIFLAYEPRRIKALTDRLCDFADLYGHPDSIPLRLIATHEDRDRYRLPIGSFLNVDTGSKVPELIHRNSLPAAALTRRTDAYRVIRPASDHTTWNELVKPEEYLLDEKPFLIHYRKGGSKSGEITTKMNYDAERFKEDVNCYLSTNGR